MQGSWAAPRALVAPASADDRMGGGGGCRGGAANDGADAWGTSGDSACSHAAPGADGESAIDRMAPNATAARRAVNVGSEIVDAGSMLQLWAWVLWIACRWFLVEYADKLIIQRSGAACREATVAVGAVPHG